MNKDYYEIAGKAFSNSRKGMFWPELKLLEKHVSSSKAVLDVGCGNGRLLDHISLKTNQYLGVDFSEELLREARALHPGYVFENHNMISLPFSDGSFDVVCFIASLHHLRSGHFQVLKNAYRILKSGGILFMMNWNLYRDAPALKTRVVSKDGHTDWYIPALGVERYYYGFTVDELDKLLVKAEFIVEMSGLFTDGKEVKNGNNIVHVAKKN